MPVLLSWLYLNDIILISAVKPKVGFMCGSLDFLQGVSNNDVTEEIRAPVGRIVL
jgi:hypothetical protein